MWSSKAYPGAWKSQIKLQRFAENKPYISKLGSCTWALLDRLPASSPWWKVVLCYPKQKSAAWALIRSVLWYSLHGPEALTYCSLSSDVAPPILSQWITIVLYWAGVASWAMLLECTSTCQQSHKATWPCENYSCDFKSYYDDVSWMIIDLGTVIYLSFRGNLNVPIIQVHVQCFSRHPFLHSPSLLALPESTLLSTNVFEDTLFPIYRPGIGA